MSKITNIKTINIVSIALGILALLVLSAVTPNKAHAQGGFGTYQGYNTTNFTGVNPYANTQPNYQYPTYTQAPAPVYQPVYQPAPQPTVIVPAQTSYVPAPTTTAYNGTPTIYSNTAVAKATTAKKTTTTVAKANTTSTDGNSGNSLAGNLIFGSNGFLPSGLLGWILTAIIILIIIILARRAFGTYHKTPLKHA